MTVSLDDALLQGIGQFDIPQSSWMQIFAEQTRSSEQFSEIELSGSASLLLGNPAQKIIKNELKMLNDTHDLQSKRIKVNITPQHWVSQRTH